MKEEKAKREFPGGRSKWRGFLCLCFLVSISIVPVCFASERAAYRFGPRDNPYGIRFIDDSRGWIVGNMGLAATTADGGKNWQRVTVSGLEPFKDVFFVGNAGWIVGDGGLIVHTENGGKTWTKQTSGVAAALLRVCFLDEKKGFTLGADGTVLKTADGGLTWEVVPLDWLQILPPDLVERGVISINLYDVFFADGLSGWIVGDYGTVLRTVDGGKSWVLSQCGSFPSLFAVFFKSKQEGWAVGQNGYFIKTADGGKSWKNGPSLTEENLYRVVFRGDYGAIVGDHGVIIKTNDSGKTWMNDPLNLPPPLPWLVDAAILPEGRSAKVLGIGKGLLTNTAINPR